MTSTGRLNRSCFCAVVAVIASTLAVLVRGVLANQSNTGSSEVGDLQFYLLGLPLAPGWFLIRGVLEESSMLQLLRWALVIPFVSVVIDTGIIFGTWQVCLRVNGVTNKHLSS